MVRTGLSTPASQTSSTLSFVSLHFVAFPGQSSSGHHADQLPADNFFRGWNAIGLKTQPQPSGGDANGAFYGPVSIKGRNQSRDSASTAYYRPIAARENFHLITGSTVSKINFDKKVACSVNFISRETNRTSTAKAAKEVILAAGAPHSPQILQLSGVGPEALLSKFGIDVVGDLPGVGLNFQDQVSIGDVSCTNDLANRDSGVHVHAVRV